MVISPQGYKNSQLISNPVIVFELYEDSDLEIDLDNIFSNISLEIGGYVIDKLYLETNSNNLVDKYQNIKNK